MGAPEDDQPGSWKNPILAELHEDILASIGEGVSIVSSGDLLIRYTNPGFDAMFGYAPGELLGQEVLVLNAGTELEQAGATLTVAANLLAYESWCGELRSRRKDGSTFWCRVSVTVRNLRHWGRGWIMVHGDITHQKRIEAELRRSADSLRLLVEQAPDGIFVTDAEGGQIDINPAGAAMVGYRRDEIRAMNLVDFVLPDEVPGLAAEMARARQGQIVSREWVIRRQDGSTFSAEIVGRQLPDGRLQGIVRDITEHKRAEEQRVAALERQRDTLVREVHHRIKNHLQGVIGLLRNAMSENPEISGPIDTAIGRIRAIAVVYGMSRRFAEGQVPLRDLLQMLVESAAGPVGVRYEAAPSPMEPLLSQEDAVPVALVANELIANALKHLDAPNPRRPVRVSFVDLADGVCIRVSGGPAHLPPGFDFAGGRGLGGGLELVGTLLPQKNAKLTFRQQGDEVVAELGLTLPAS